MKIKDRILIIEDDTAMIDMLKTVFKIGEYDVFVAKKRSKRDIFIAVSGSDYFRSGILRWERIRIS